MSQNVLAPQYPQRRTFRGRGGPTDRRLPKQNAARRRPQQLRPQPQTDSACPPQTPADTVLVATFAEEEPTAAASCVSIDEVFQPELEQKDTDLLHSTNSNNSMIISSVDTLLEKELTHLHKRIQNNRFAMSMSAAALANPATYQTNVLGACQNTVKEWRSICNRYCYCEDHACSSIIDTKETTQETWRTTGQAIFELVQQSVQCGPLAGSRPAYLKRCGADTAKLVHSYLEAILVLLPNSGADGNSNSSSSSSSKQDTIRVLGFTEKQTAAIVTWKRNAQKAAERTGEQPSRSVLKNQEKAVTAKNRKANNKKEKWTN